MRLLAVFLVAICLSSAVALPQNVDFDLYNQQYNQQQQQPQQYGYGGQSLNINIPHAIQQLPTLDMQNVPMSFGNVGSYGSNLISQEYTGKSLPSSQWTSQSFSVPIQVGLSGLASSTGDEQRFPQQFGSSHWEQQQQQQLPIQQQQYPIQQTLNVDMPMSAGAGYTTQQPFGFSGLSHMQQQQQVPFNLAQPLMTSSPSWSVGIQNVPVNIPYQHTIQQNIPVSVSLPANVPVKTPMLSYAGIAPSVSYASLPSTSMPVSVRPTLFQQLPVITNSMVGLASTPLSTIQQAPTITEPMTFTQNQPIIRNTIMQTLPMQQLINTNIPKQMNLGVATTYTTLNGANVPTGFSSAIPVSLSGSMPTRRFWGATPTENNNNMPLMTGSGMQQQQSFGMPNSGMTTINTPQGTIGVFQQQQSL